MTHQIVPQGQGRSPARLLVDRKFGPFFVGKLVSASGIWIQNITAAILVFDLTGSALAVGAVSVFQFAPQLLLTPWMGAFSDRVDRRKLLILGRLISLLASANLAVWLVILGVDGLPGVWPIYATALALGIGAAVSSPAMNALVPGLVPDADLFSAIALNSSTGNIARALGPALGATIYVTLGPALSFSLSAGGHGFFILSLLTIGRIQGVPESDDTSVRGGLRYLRQTPLMIVLLACVWGIGFAADAVITLTPPLSKMLGQGEVFVGILASLFGAGALLALATSSIWQRRYGLSRVTVVGFGSMALGFFLLALSPSPEMALLSVVMSGYGFLLSTSSITSRIQRRVPESLRGRIMAIWAMGFLGARPIAAFMNGFVADNVSVRAAIGMSVAVSIAAGTLAYLKAPAQRSTTEAS